MKKNEPLIEKFEMEELEHRYEMSWISEVEVTAPIEGQDVTVTIPIK